MKIKNIGVLYKCKLHGMSDKKKTIILVINASQSFLINYTNIYN